MKNWEKIDMARAYLGVIILTVMFILQFSPVSATLEGDFKQGRCLQLLGSSSAASMNISSITYPNGSTIFQTLPMTKNDRTFNYTFCNTLAAGHYTYNYYDSNGDMWVNDFSIGRTIITIIALLLFGIILLFIAIYKKIPLIGLASGVLISIGGVFVLIYGFGTMQDVYTQAIGYVSLFLGLAIAFAASYEWYFIGATGDEE